MAADWMPLDGGGDDTLIVRSVTLVDDSVCIQVFVERASTQDTRLPSKEEVRRHKDWIEARLEELATGGGSN